MKRMAKFFIDNSKLTIVLSVFLGIYGLMGLGKMNAESYPNVNLAMATVITVYQGASADDIETKITKPLEDEIRTVSGLKDVRSISQAGLSSIFVQVDMDNVDSVDDVMSDVQKAIDRATGLPQDLNDPPKFTEIKSEEFPVFQIAVTGTNENRQRDKIADELKEVLEDNKKVKSVILAGYAQRRFQIILDNQKLLQEHIGIEEVMAKVGTRNVNIPGGSLKAQENQKLLRLEAKVQSAKDLENVLIRSNFSGKSIFLKDIAKVVDGEEEIKVRASYNGVPATLITVSKKAGSDTLELVEDVNHKLEEFRTIYKGQADFFVFQNEALKVKNKLEVLANNAISGLLLVVIFLFIFLPGKIGIAASISLPLAVMATLGMMPNMDMNLNSITILALVIALGMLVDNSVVISENFTRLKQEGYSSKEAAVNSVGQLWLPITATAFTTIAAFMPMLVTKGVMGQFIKYIPIIVSISLLLSLVESFFFLPMRLTWAGDSITKTNKKKNKEAKNSDWFTKFENLFEKLMDKVVRYRYIVAVGFSGLIILSLFMIGVANKFILFPADQTEIYIARFKMDNGTRVEKTLLAAERLSQDIKKELGSHAEHLITRAGESKVQLTDPKAEDGNNVGIVFIYVDDDAKFNMSHTEILGRLRNNVKADYVKEVSFEAQINGPPVGEPIEATFRSNNVEKIDELIAKIKTDLSKVNGILDLKVDDVIGDDEVYIHIDYKKADQLGLNVNAIGDAVRVAVSGKIASTVTLNNKDVDLYVRLNEQQRTNVDDLKLIKIMDNRGNLVPLGSIAEFDIKNGAPQIKRYDFKRSKTLLGSVDEEVITSVIANQHLTKIFNKYKADYPGVSLEFGGAAESTKESMESLASAGLLAAIGIFAILVFLFRSYLRPLIIMMTIPLGLLGFSIAFYLPVLSGYADRSRPISFLALIGIIGLAGIIVNSGIVLISFIDQMREEGKLSLHEILVKASGMRLRAVLVTSLTTISGLIPTAYGIGGTDAMLVPMTLAMAWGLTAGTILTLIFIPCSYAILEDFLSLVNRLLKRDNTEELPETPSRPSGDDSLEENPA